MLARLKLNVLLPPNLLSGRLGESLWRLHTQRTSFDRTGVRTEAPTDIGRVPPWNWYLSPNHASEKPTLRSSSPGGPSRPSRNVSRNCPERLGKRPMSPSR
jgi:hypothetical protein